MPSKIYEGILVTAISWCKRVVVLVIATVANVKNQPPNFKQLIPCAWRTHWCLNNRTLKLHSTSVYCVRTALKLLDVAKGLKYGWPWYHHDDVMLFSTLDLPKTLLRVSGVSKFATLSCRDRCAKVLELFLCCRWIRNWVKLWRLAFIAGKQLEY